MWIRNRHGCLLLDLLYLAMPIGEASPHMIQYSAFYPSKKRETEKRQT